ncbi:MAG: GNAT family N-acetyltransferase [Sphingobacteriales bacterium]|nr:MAG: GNAT family N-acetyltransferase [Sphingobacteriales bacterium]
MSAFIQNPAPTATNTNTVPIRRARPEDCPAMMELIRELAIYEKAEHEVSVSLEAFRDAGFGAHPIWTAFVAESEGHIVGLSLFYPRYSTWKGRKLYLEDIVVRESLRGQKIGRQLFDHTLAYAKAHKYHSLYWQVLDWNEPAIHFYKKYKATFDGEWLNVHIDC